MGTGIRKCVPLQPCCLQGCHLTRRRPVVDVLLWLEYYSSLVAVRAMIFQGHVGDFMAYQRTTIKRKQEFWLRSLDNLWPLLPSRCACSSEKHMETKYSNRSLPKAGRLGERTTAVQLIIGPVAVTIHKVVSMCRPILLPGNQPTFQQCYTRGVLDLKDVYSTHSEEGGIRPALHSRTDRSQHMCNAPPKEETLGLLWSPLAVVLYIQICFCLLAC